MKSFGVWLCHGFPAFGGLASAAAVLILGVGSGLARAQTAPSAGTSAPSAGSADDLAALEARVHALEKEVDEAKALLAEADGKLLQAPPQLPDRFKQPAMLEAIRQAFRQVNPNAVVTGVDCAEYPCIAYGNGVKPDQLDALRSSLALAGYGQDNLKAFTWGDAVAVIPTPKSDPNLSEQSEQRILTRFHRMINAGKPQ